MTDDFMAVLRHRGRVAERRRAINATSSVYFILCDAPPRYIKIGVAEKVEQRLHDLRAANPYPLKLLATMSGGVPAERKLHKRFAHCRHNREWFLPTPELLAFIDALPKPPPFVKPERVTVCENCVPRCLDCDVPYYPGEGPFQRRHRDILSARMAQPVHGRFA